MFEPEKEKLIYLVHIHKGKLSMKRRSIKFENAEKLTNEKDFMRKDLPRSFFDNEKEYINYRLSYLMEKSKEFREKEDWSGERECLDELLRVVSENPTISKRILKEQLKIWEAQKKATEIYLSKSFKKRAEVCKEVADLSTPPDEPPTSKKALKLRRKMKIKQAIWSATMHKWLAFDAMDKQRPGLDGLSKAMEHMGVAIKHEKEACSLEEKRDESQLRYFSYWRNVFMARRESLEKRFDTASQALNQAIEDAKFFEDRDKKIFPNHYPDLDALKNERIFIEAHRFLVNKDCKRSLEKLKVWLDKSEDYKGTWRYNNVKIRYFVVQALLQLPNISSRDIQKEIGKLQSEVILGDAVKNLANILLCMVIDSEKGISRERIEEEYLEKICQSFPIDYVPENDFADISALLYEKKDYFDYLPQYFTDTLQQIAKIKDPLKGISLVDDWLKNYLIVIAEYYYLECSEREDLVEEFDSAFEKKSIEQLYADIERLLDNICRSPSESKRKRKAFKTVRKYLDRKKAIYSSDKKELENLEAVVKLAKRVVLSTCLDFFPQIILVKDKRFNEHKGNIYKCERIWKDPFFPRLFELYGKRIFNIGNYYYLSPEWKNKKHKEIPSDRLDLEAYKSELFEWCISGSINFNVEGLKEVKIAIVQLETKDEIFDDNFRIEEEFRSNQIFNYLDKAVNEGAQVVVFPELSIPEDALEHIESRVEELKRQKGYDVFVIAGTHYDDDSCNVCPIITPYGVYNQYKRNPSEPEKGKMKIRDRRTITFTNTGFGDFAVLICYDFTSDRIIDDLKDKIDFLFVISRNRAVERWKERFEYLSLNNYWYIVSANDDKYGGSAFYAPFRYRRELDKKGPYNEGIIPRSFKVSELDEARRNINPHLYEKFGRPNADIVPRHA